MTDTPQALPPRRAELQSNAGGGGSPLGEVQANQTEKRDRRELMDRWLGGRAQVDLARGEYSHGWSYENEGRKVAGRPTRILELVESEKLAYGGAVGPVPDSVGRPGPFQERQEPLRHHF